MWRSLSVVALILMCMCTTPRTEVKVTMTTDLDWGPDASVRSVVVTVRSRSPDGPPRGGSPRVFPVGRGAGLHAMPASFGVVPLAEDDTGVVWIEAHACAQATGCAGVGDAGTTSPIVTQRAITSFARETTTRLDLYLVDACRNVRCDDPQTTCDPCTRACVDARGRVRPPGGCEAGGRPSDAGVQPSDVPLTTVQRSCPNPRERGCGTVLITGGTTPFTMGDDLAAPVQSQISVDDFVLDAYEVTVARFRRYWQASPFPHPAPTGPIVYPGRTIPWSGDVSQLSQMAGCTFSNDVGSLETHPMNCTNWATAQAFCIWDGGRLPTEAEWEYAARGREGRVYPWGGNAPEARVCASPSLNPCEVGSVPSGRTPEGIFDLAGNVLELVADTYVPYTDSTCWGGISRRNPVCTVGPPPGFAIAYVGRGGAVGGAVEYLRAAWRIPSGDDGVSRYRGFRCARSR